MKDIRLSKIEHNLKVISSPREITNMLMMGIENYHNTSDNFIQTQFESKYSFLIDS